MSVFFLFIGVCNKYGITNNQAKAIGKLQFIKKKRKGEVASIPKY